MMSTSRSTHAASFAATRSDAEWRASFTPERFRILRRHGAEAPDPVRLAHESRAGLYGCAGWPSFWRSLPGAVALTDDNSLFMRRTEAHCARCGGHLGHVFDDGLEPTGRRYCMDGAALPFQPSA